MARLKRGEIYLVSPAPAKGPKRRRAFIVVSRQTLCDSPADRLVCAPVNSRDEGLSTEVRVGVDEGLKHPSVINCDQLLLLPKAALSNYVGVLSDLKLRQLRAALRVALAVE